MEQNEKLGWGFLNINKLLRKNRSDFCFRACGGRGCNGRGFLFLSTSALDAGSLAPQFAQVIQAGAADLAFTDHFDGANHRRMQWKDALNAYTKADAADGESGAGGPAFLRDHHAFKSLEAFLFLLTLAFLQADVHANSITRAELGKVFAQLRFMQFTDCRVHVRASF